ncbi:patatin-like phospholipase family protein [Methylobacterium radiotolerans]|uniref:patatin-like phospholipase family protein n=1 Tax=Methylobacterium TaxID=407 RepID=UPI0005E92A6D|nr:patatin-like phospholipase family protein [Methylobacterium radiotolerans]MBN6821507.1 patatin-like phospholipase family protein [Methylobacterium organophilum]OXE42435.1 cyclic nucleotide-binding protein [Methylobacterium radiotolerans]GAN47057.1 cyclic nucleotide-binding protein [Methylobacterium sp. ME121]
MSAPEIPFLAGLDAPAVAAVRARMVPVAVPGGRTLFEQGDTGDALYTLVSGAVGVSARDHAGRPTRIARLRPPETFGEMALLSDAPRAATVMALRDSHLVQLTRDAFEAVIAEHPHTLLYFARMLADRLRAIYDGYSVHHAPRIFTILAVTEGPDPARVARQLAAAFDVLLPGETGCLTDWPEGADEAWFQAFEGDHARTIFAAHDIDCPWCRQSQRRGDHVLLLAEPGAPPRPGAAAYLDRVRSDWIRMDLVVRQDPGARRPKALHPEVAALPAAMRIQVRDGDRADLHRLARLASGSARGLVLGGGGARGLAHLGVLKALDEVSCAPDFVGGTSMGAIIAASLAMGWSVAEIQAQIEAFFATSNPINDYTLPLHALTRGAKVDAGLAARYGGVRIEDLWLPFFCVSSNLTTGNTMVHRSGDLPKALRASIAIPGLLPPVLCDEGVLVDGGMMNNLPADVAAGLERGPVLAVDVGTDRAFQDMPRRGWSGRLMRKLIGSPLAMPGLAPLLLRAATVSSDSQSLMAAAHATAVLKPQLSGIDLRAWSRFRESAELGYRETRAGIATGTLARWLDPVR